MKPMRMRALNSFKLRWTGRDSGECRYSCPYYLPARLTYACVSPVAARYPSRIFTVPKPRPPQLPTPPSQVSHSKPHRSLGRSPQRQAKQIHSCGVTHSNDGYLKDRSWIVNQHRGRSCQDRSFKCPDQLLRSGQHGLLNAPAPTESIAAVDVKYQPQKDDRDNADCDSNFHFRIHLKSPISPVEPSAVAPRSKLALARNDKGLRPTDPQISLRLILCRFSIDEPAQHPRISPASE